MIALLGCLCILSGGGLGIWLQLRERRRRREALQELERILWRMAEEIRMAGTPMPVLLHRLAADSAGEAACFLERVSLAIEQGEPLSQVWGREVDVLPLAAQEKAALQTLNLQGDSENICNGILLVRNCIQKSREDQEERFAEETKRTAALWGSAAALLVILLV